MGPNISGIAITVSDKSGDNPHMFMTEHLNGKRALLEHKHRKTQTTMFIIGTMVVQTIQLLKTVQVGSIGATLRFYRSSP